LRGVYIKHSAKVTTAVPAVKFDELALRNKIVNLRLVAQEMALNLSNYQTFLNYFSEVSFSFRYFHMLSCLIFHNIFRPHTVC